MKKMLFMLVALCSGMLSGAAFAQKAESLSLIKPGVLTVCAYDHFSPLLFQDKEGNTIGYEADILAAVAKKWNVSLAYQKETVFDGIWKKPSEKQCDVAAAGLTALPEREKQGAAFTIPHFIADQSLLIRASDKDTLHSIKDFAGKKIGVITGTTNEAQVKSTAPKSTIIVPYPYQTDMLIALSNKQIDAVADDTSNNGHYATLNTQLTMIDVVSTKEQISFAIDRKNKALLNSLNQTLMQIRQEGELQKIYSQWFEGAIDF